MLQYLSDRTASARLKVGNGVRATQEFLDKPVVRKVRKGGDILTRLGAVYPFLAIHIFEPVGLLKAYGYNLLPESINNFVLQASMPAVRLFIVCLSLPGDLYNTHPNWAGLLGIATYGAVFYGGLVYAIRGLGREQPESDKDIHPHQEIVAMADT